MRTPCLPELASNAAAAWSRGGAGRVPSQAGRPGQALAEARWCICRQAGGRRPPPSGLCAQPES